MQKVNLSLLLLVVFLLGACAAMVAKEVVVPPARAGTEPQKWEIISIKSSGGLHGKPQREVANKYGAKGWELVCVDQYDQFYFKRPL